MSKHETQTTPPEPPPCRKYNAFGVLLNQKEIDEWRSRYEPQTVLKNWLK